MRPTPPSQPSPSSQSSRSPVPPVSPAFHFGVATSDHQCEAYVPEYEDIRDVWERRRNLTPRGQATDFWVRYPEDIALARELGCKLFRISLAWARIEPGPGQVNRAALDHYRQVIATIRDAGMEPLVTLHHFTWPVHIEERGGLLAAEFPHLFADYTRLVADHLGQAVTCWIPFNEPSMLIFGYIKPWWEAHYFLPPGLPTDTSLTDQMLVVGQVIRNLFRAHTQARAILKTANPAAQVGANPLLLGYPEWAQRLMDWNATRLRTPAQFVSQGRRLIERPLPDHGAVDVVIAGLTDSPAIAEDVALTETYFLEDHMPCLVAVAPGAHDLQTAVAQAVRRFKRSGAWAASYRRHFGVDATPPSAHQTLADIGGLTARLTDLHPPGQSSAQAITGETVRRIQQRGRLIVGVRADTPGLGYRDPSSGQLAGLEIDLAHALAQAILGDATRVELRVTTRQTCIPLLRSVGQSLDGVLRLYSIFSTALTSNWWHLGMAGQLAEFLCPAECVGQQDFVGFDYYWGINTLRLTELKQLFGAAAGRFETAPVWPGALYQMLTYHHRLFPGVPILIIENGCIEVADGVTRADYLQRHLAEVRRALQDGVNIVGYLCWAITSNREWGLPFGPASDFGLYHIELDTDPTLTRQPTPAAEMYQSIIRASGL